MAKLYFNQPDFVQLELSSTQCTQLEFLRKFTTHPKEKLIWDCAKVDDKKKYWQKYREKEEEIKLDKDENQAGAELGQAQPQLGFWELISFSFKVENLFFHLHIQIKVYS